MMQVSPTGCTDRSWPPVCSTTWAAAALQSPATLWMRVPTTSGEGADTTSPAANAATLRGKAMCYAFKVMPMWPEYVLT